MYINNDIPIVKIVSFIMPELRVNGKPWLLSNFYAPWLYSFVDFDSLTVSFCIVAGNFV